MQRWLNTNGRTRTPAPMQVHYSVGIPSDAVGSDGDFAFVYSNDGLGVFKKYSGTWHDTSVTNSYSSFIGWNGTNSQLLEMTTTFTYVNITGFTFDEDIGLQVEVDGISQYEGAGNSWTRDVANNRIVFSETIEANSGSPVKVFVGKFVGAGFGGFSNTNSELFELTADFDHVDLTNFSVQYGDMIRVEIDGITRYEGPTNDWTRDVVNNRILFNETLTATTTHPVKVFVGRYN